MSETTQLLPKIPENDQNIVGMCSGCLREWMTSPRGGGKCAVCGCRVIPIRMVGEKYDLHSSNAVFGQ